MDRILALATCFESAIPLPGPRADDCHNPVSVRFLPLAELRDDGVGHRMDGTTAILDFRPQAELVVRPDSITLFHHVAMDERSKASFVTTVGAGVVAQLRGRIVFHGSAWIMGGVAIAVVGESGSGKSTLAGAALRAGRSLVTDDVLCLDGVDDPHLLPSFSEVRLARDSAAVLELLGDNIQSVGALDERQRLAYIYMERFSSQPSPLGAICVLGSGEEWGMRAMSGGEAITELVRHTFASRLVRSRDAMERQFAAVTAIAGRIPVAQLTRGPLERVLMGVEVAEAFAALDMPEV